MRVSVQEADFDLAAELRDLSAGRTDIGAVVSFTGVVRQNAEGTLRALELEHYPAMTEQALTEIAKQAQERWKLSAVAVIHRVGVLKIGEQIMMVATAAPHRGDAFQAAEFLMDYLKSRAPFWKKEHFTDETTEWVAARFEDEESLNRW